MDEHEMVHNRIIITAVGTVLCLSPLPPRKRNSCDYELLAVEYCFNDLSFWGSQTQTGVCGIYQLEGNKKKVVQASISGAVGFTGISLNN